MARIDMLPDDDRGRETLRQALEQLEQHVNPIRRHADHNQ
jgi:hypothetical protein